MERREVREKRSIWVDQSDESKCAGVAGGGVRVCIGYVNVSVF